MHLTAELRDGSAAPLLIAQNTVWLIEIGLDVML